MKFKQPAPKKCINVRIGTVMLWLFVAGMVMATCCNLKEGLAASLPGTPLVWEKVSMHESSKATNRVQVDIVIVPTADQTDATKGDLIATVMQAAMEYHKLTGAAIVSARMICQRAANTWGEGYLALAVYIPDGKGYNGEQEIGPWDMRMTAQRGYTMLEKDYLRLWAELRASYQKGDTIDEEALDAEVSRCLMVKPRSVTPHFNYMENYK